MDTAARSPEAVRRARRGVLMSEALAEQHGGGKSILTAGNASRSWTSSTALGRDAASHTADPPDGRQPVQSAGIGGVEPVVARCRLDRRALRPTLPLADPSWCDDQGRKYPGPSVAVVDANTYSSGDLFSSGRVDHGHWSTSASARRRARAGRMYGHRPSCRMRCPAPITSKPDAGWNRLHSGVPARDSICSRRRDPDRGSRHTRDPVRDDQSRSDERQQGLAWLLH
jgi:hypothetical protein